MKYLTNIINCFKLKYQLTKLKIKDGDVLVFKEGVDYYPRNEFDHSELRTIRKFLGKNCILVYVHEKAEIFTLDKEQMNKYGWIRNADTKTT